MHGDEQRKYGRVTVRAEIRVTLLQTREHQEFLEAKGGKEEAFLRAFRGSRHFDLRLQSLKTVR